jgi:hypothetical protein
LPDVIVVGGTGAMQASHPEIPTTPIVLALADEVIE